LYRRLAALQFGFESQPVEADASSTGESKVVHGQGKN